MHVYMYIHVIIAVQLLSDLCMLEARTMVGVSRAVYIDISFPHVHGILSFFQDLS